MLDGATVTAVADGSQFCEFCGRTIKEGEHYRFSAVVDDEEFYTQHICAPCGRMWDEAADNERVSETDVESHLWGMYCDDCGMEGNCVNTPPQKCLFVRAEYGDAEASDYIRKHYPKIETAQPEQEVHNRV